MLSKGTRCFRTLLLMPRRRRIQNGLSATVIKKEPKKTSTSLADAKSDQPELLLPEIPLRPKSVAASRNIVDRKKGTVVSKHAHIVSSSAKEKERNVGVTKSYSDTLVAKLSDLSLGPASRKHASKQSSARRYFTTFNVKGIEDVAELIKSEKCKNIIVMAGAGISTPSGIPDFRTPGTGLYDNLAEYKLPEPSAIFDINFFSYNPKPFFRLAKELYPGNYQPNFVHYFIRMLHEKRQLLKMFTQNIDALERAAGIPEFKLVEAHGSFATATCRRCKAKYKGTDIKDEVMKQVVPKCKQAGCIGIVKPDIIFFGEDLPRKFFEYPRHFTICDLLIVLGTSLEVYPFAGLVDEVNRSTPRILMNRDVVGPFVKRRKRSNDVVVKGDIVDSVRHLVQLLGWTESIETLMMQEQQCVGTLGKDTQNQIESP